MIDYTEGSGLQYHIGVSSDMVGEYVILPGDPGRCEKIAAFFENPKKVGQNREFTTYTGTLAGRKVSVTSTGIGGPSAAICMEELARCGVKTFIRVGTCGGMQTNVLGGDLIIANGAVRMEGTSKEYAPIEFPAVANFEVTRALVDAAEAKEYPYHVGVVECKDSFYGQHEPEKKPVSYELENKWKAWMRCGVLASEMESAALYTVAPILKVKCGTILLTVANQERAKLGLPNPQVHDTGKAIEIAVDAIKRLIENEEKK